MTNQTPRPPNAEEIASLRKEWHEPYPITIPISQSIAPPEIGSTEVVEERRRRIATAYEVVKKAEYAAQNAERILDDAREEWESLVHGLMAEGSSTGGGERQNPAR